MAANEDKFTWRIEKFSTLKNAEIHSPTFSLKGHQWKICFHPPKRRGLGSRCMDIPAVLEFADSESVLSLVSDFRLYLVNQLKHSYSMEFSNFYFSLDHAYNFTWSLDSFLFIVVSTNILAAFREKHNQNGIVSKATTLCVPEGFLVNDTLVFEARIRKVNSVDSICFKSKSSSALSFRMPGRLFEQLTSIGFTQSLEKTLYNNLEVVRPVMNYECDEIAELYNSIWDGIFSDVSETMPRTKEELKQLYGIGKEELRQYGDQILQIVASTMSDYYRVREEGSGSKGNKSSDSAKRKRTTATIEPPEAINDLSTEPLSTENQEPGVSKDAYDQDGRVSVSTPLSSKVARTSTAVSPCSSNVQSTSKNLIAELSTMASSWKSTSVDDAQKSTNDANMDSALLQEQRGKLAEFFEMSLEAICQANWFDKVHEIVLKISDLATDPFEKTVLKDLLSRLGEFRSSTPEYLSIVESSPVVETSSTETTNQLKESLLDRQNELTLLDSEVSRIEKDQLKVDAEIQQLLARKEKLFHDKNSALAKMEAANKEASRGLRELKRKQAEHEQAMDNLMTAKEKLTQNNASWKLFKENLGL
ncbi:ATP-dependent DNA helicase Q-like 4A [Linum perenne]